MRVTFHGVRGSIPAPGPETNRYGGNTSCVSVRGAGGELVILDMGTGLVGLGKELMAQEFGRGAGAATVLLSHAHWDHIQGFPFFAPAFVPGNSFRVHGMARSSSLLEGILEGQMNPSYSPISSLRNLGATIELVAVTTGMPFDLGGGISVCAALNPHGSTAALAFRIEQAGRSVVYAPDVGYPDGGPSAEVLALYRGADLLIHDCTYTPADRAERRTRGYSSYADAADAAARAGVAQLAMFHYDQDYGDDVVDELARACRAELDHRGATACTLTAAREGMTLEV
ncbi:MAG: MBL fold metallo-hydrolase [Myxococcales bacterium]|nr:MBL fold metallo-hydrolase [Myxococcales bacterium]